jgi:transcriptional regulator with XRE-family HTH domain
MPGEPIREGEESLPGPSPAALAEAMRAMRVERGVSVADAAAGAGVTPAHLVAVEEGRREADYELIVRLADTIGVRPAEFIGRAEDMETRPEERRG